MNLDLERIFWLAGSPCAGKTTLSQIIADHFKWTIYHCDEWFDRHRQRSTPEYQPTLYHVSRLQGDDLWLRPVAKQIRTEIDFCVEEFDFVLHDLAELQKQSDTPILFEGTPAVPHVLKPLLPGHYHALWLVPTEHFQRHYYAQRPWIHGYLNQTSAPERAFDNWMARDAGFARWLEHEVAAHHLAWINVDGSLTIEQTAALIIEHFSRAER